MIRKGKEKSLVEEELYEADLKCALFILSAPTYVLCDTLGSFFFND